MVIELCLIRLVQTVIDWSSELLYKQLRLLAYELVRVLPPRCSHRKENFEVLLNCLLIFFGITGLGDLKWIIAIQLLVWCIIEL